MAWTRCSSTPAPGRITATACATHFGFAHARPTACQLEVGDSSSVGSFPTATYTFESVDHYLLQVERFSRLLLGHSVPSWPIEDALHTLRTIEALFASGRQDGWQTLAA